MSFSILFTFPPNSYSNLYPLFLISHCQALSSLGQISHLTGLVVVCLSPLIIHPSAVPIFPVRVIYWLEHLQWIHLSTQSKLCNQALTCFSACILYPCSYCGPHLSFTQLPTFAWTRFVSRAILLPQPTVLCPSASSNAILISEDLSHTLPYLCLLVVSQAAFRTLYCMPVSVTDFVVNWSLPPMRHSKVNVRREGLFRTQLLLNEKICWHITQLFLC